MAEHPGAVLLRHIRDRNLRSADFEAAGLDVAFVRNLARQRCDLSGENAKHIGRIAAITCTTAPMWEKLQANYVNRAQAPRRVAREFTSHRSCLVATCGYQRGAVK